MSTDISREMIIAKVKMATDSNFYSLSRKYGKSNNWLAQALWRPFPKAENIISDIIGIPVIEIWPSRFNDDGTRKDKRRQEKKKTNSTVSQA